MNSQPIPKYNPWIKNCWKPTPHTLRGTGSIRPLDHDETGSPNEVVFHLANRLSLLVLYSCLLLLPIIFTLPWDVLFDFKDSLFKRHLARFVYILSSASNAGMQAGRAGTDLRISLLLTAELRLSLHQVLMITNQLVKEWNNHNRNHNYYHNNMIAFIII